MIMSGNIKISDYLKRIASNIDGITPLTHDCRSIASLTIRNNQAADRLVILGMSGITMHCIVLDRLGNIINDPLKGKIYMLQTGAPMYSVLYNGHRETMEILHICNVSSFFKEYCHRLNLVR